MKEVEYGCRIQYRRQYWKSYGLVLLLCVCLDCTLIGACLFSMWNQKLPESITVTSGTNTIFDFSVPASATIEASDTIYRLNRPISIRATGRGAYKMKVKLFSMIPMKTMDVTVIEEQYVTPCGIPVGIYVKTRGVLILDTAMIQGTDLQNYEPSKGICQKGDYIIGINGIKIEEKEELIRELAKCTTNEVVLQIVRDGIEMELPIKAVETKQGYQLGIWVRDDMQGIGTLTYVDGDHFAALGHGVSDIDTGTMLAIDSGMLYEAHIMSMVKGERGKPGELVGMLNYQEKECLGEIEQNTIHGIFGDVNGNMGEEMSRHLEAANTTGETYLKRVPVALKQDVTLGKAYIRSSISGECRDYEIKITDIKMNSRDSTKCMEIEIVDPELLGLTNGIIQGMSGTPILQNGHVIGAVTHVFVHNPTRGYGIFIEEMLKE